MASLIATYLICGPRVGSVEMVERRKVGKAWREVERRPWQTLELARRSVPEDAEGPYSWAVLNEEGIDPHANGVPENLIEFYRLYRASGS